MAYVTFITMPEYLHVTFPQQRERVPSTDVTRYRAILDAADHIEAHPELYDYTVVSMDEPSACMLGWIGKKHGGAFVNADAVAHELLGVSPTHFFIEMGRMMLGRDPDFQKRRDYACLHDPFMVVQGLRRLADQYRPKHIGLPACVTKIFREDALIEA